MDSVIGTACSMVGRKTKSTGITWQCFASSDRSRRRTRSPSWIRTTGCSLGICQAISGFMPAQVRLEGVVMCFDFTTTNHGNNTDKGKLTMKCASGQSGWWLVSCVILAGRQECPRISLVWWLLWSAAVVSSLSAGTLMTDTPVIMLYGVELCPWRILHRWCRGATCL